MLGPLLIRGAIPLGLLVTGWIGYCWLSKEGEKPKSAPPEPKAIRTRVIELRVQDYPVIVSAQGTVQPNNEISVSVQVSGPIIYISPEFQDGAFFSKDDLLLELDSVDYKASVAVAEARLHRYQAGMVLAKLNHERNTEIIKEDLISKAEADITAATLSQVKADVDSASAQLDQAKADLERTRVLAPFDGRVRHRNVGLGQLVGANTALGVVYAVDFAEVRLPIKGRDLAFVNLPESETAAFVPVGLRDTPTHPASTNVWNARIIRVEGALDRDSLELFAIARVDDPFGRKSGKAPLRIGQPVVGLITGRVLHDVVALPRVAVRQLDQVFLIDPIDLTLRAHTIVPLWSDEKHVVVRDPLIRNGTMLATTQLVYAPDNAKVEIIPDIPTNTTPEVSPNLSEAKPATASSIAKKKNPGS